MKESYGKVTKKGISVIICTFNGSARLVRTLDALSNQKFAFDLNCELLVIDNNSTDDTINLVENTWISFGSPFPLKIIKESRPGKAYALETGYDNASFCYLITCDDDNWLNENYLQSAYDLMKRHRNVAILGGRTQAVFEGREPIWFKGIASSFAVGPIAIKSGFIEKRNPNLWGAGMVIRTDFWVRLRQCGFSFITGKEIRKAVGEDSELIVLAQYLGYQIYYSENLSLRHFMPLDRMNMDTCKRMFQGFGRSAVPLNMYLFLASKHISRNQVTFSQFYRWQGIRMAKKMIHVFIFGIKGIWKGIMGVPTKEYKNAVKLIYQLRQLSHLKTNKRIFDLISAALLRLK